MQVLVKAKMIPGEWEPRRQAVEAPTQPAAQLFEPRVIVAAIRPPDVWHRPGLPLWVKVSIFGAVLVAAMFLAS
jgi:hypothetical protein